MGMELRNRIEAALGLRQPATILWTYPTLEKLSRYLAGETGTVTPEERPPEADEAPLDNTALSLAESELLIDAAFEALL
jgi:hypothetical protein